MRIVLDTNVFVSAALWRGVPGVITDAIERGYLDVVLTPLIAQEYRRVLARGKFTAILKRRKTTWQRLRDDLLDHAIIVPDQPSPVSIPADPTDEKFVAAAFTGGAEVLVSGDKHLLDLKQSVGIPILTPAQFLKRFKNRLN